MKIFDRDQVSGRYCAFVDILSFGATTVEAIEALLPWKLKSILDARKQPQHAPPLATP